MTFPLRLHLPTIEVEFEKTPSELIKHIKYTFSEFVMNVFSVLNEYVYFAEVICDGLAEN